MKKAMFLCGFSVASLLFSKSFEFSENLGNIYEYQSAIQEKQPDPVAIRNSGDENFEYDSFGNLIKDKDKTYTYNECGQISQITFNNGKTIELTYDDNMRLSSYGSASFAYNDFNMMSKFKNSSSDAEYFYDSKTGYRSSKIVNGIKYTFDLDDRGRLISQTDTLGNVSEIIWNEELPETLVFNGKSYNFVCNDHGDVVALTNEAGEIVNYYEYDVYGKLLSESEAVPNPIRYAHEYYDSESKLYYLRGRYYNPDIKSFTTPDPAEADARLYAYAGYDPINFIDPSGYIIVSIPGTALGMFTTEAFDTIIYYSESDLYDLYSILKLQATTLPNRSFIREVEQNLIEAAKTGRRLMNDAKIIAKQALRKKVTNKATIKAFDLLIDMLENVIWESIAKLGGKTGQIIKFLMEHPESIESVETIIDVVYSLSTKPRHEADAELVQNAIDNMKGICIMEKGTNYKIHTCPISQVREYANKYKQYKVK